MLYFCNNFLFFTNIILHSLVVANYYATEDRVPFPKHFVGSNLFGDGNFMKKCFSVEDVALLSARSKFEAFIPNFTLSNDLENDHSVEQMLEYLQDIDGLMNVTVADSNIQYITQAAFYDTMGGYLHFFYLPFVKFSFYAGTLTYRSMLKVYNFQNNCKQMLNTNGNGWRTSTLKFLKMKYQIQPINIHSNGLETLTRDIFKDPCGNLLLSADDDDYTSDYTDRELIVSLPRIQLVDNDNILSVWLPFKDKRNFILNSKSSAFVLTRYYVDVLKCYQFRNVISNPFNRRFRQLLYEKVLPLIHTDEFYPGFGAILRVWETLKQNGAIVRSIHKYDVDANKFWDDTAGLVNEAIPNLVVRDVNQSNDGQTLNETNFFSKMIDSLKNFEREWNQKQKIKYICLAVIVTVIGLLIIMLCIFISRERRTKNVNRSTLTRERKNDWKILLRKLSGTSDKNDARVSLYSESDLGFTKYEGSTSLASDTESTKPTNQSSNNISARHKKLKIRNSKNVSFSTSSSSTIYDSTKSKQRKIYRKIRNEINQSHFGNQIQGRPRSIYSAMEMPPELNQSYNFKFKKKTKEIAPKKKKERCNRGSSDSEKEMNSSDWETFSSSKVS